MRSILPTSATWFSTILLGLVVLSCGGKTVVDEQGADGQGGSVALGSGGMSVSATGGSAPSMGGSVGWAGSAGSSIGSAGSAGGSSAACPTTTQSYPAG
jgi:hypothetical protein